LAEIDFPPEPEMPSEQELHRLIRACLERAAGWERKAEGYRALLDARRLIFGEDQVVARDSAAVEKKLDAVKKVPTKPEAILRLFRAAPDRAWKPVEVHDALVAMGWGPRNAANPVQTVGATLSRMRKQKKLVKDSDGGYRLPSLTTGGT
jgi:hypothetical protein